MFVVTKLLLLLLSMTGIDGSACSYWRAICLALVHTQGYILLLFLCQSALAARFVGSQ